MATITKQAQLYEFGPFRLDAGERLLLRDGSPAALARTLLKTLLALVERSSHFVEKEVLVRTLAATFYSNRVAVVVEQPVKIRLPFGSYTSAVPAELYSVPFESNTAS